MTEREEEKGAIAEHAVRTPQSPSPSPSGLVAGAGSGGDGSFADVASAS